MTDNTELLEDEDLVINAEFSINAVNYDHSVLTNRNIADQHTIGAITGLQSALDDKASEEALEEHIDDTDNPHEVTKAQVGLGNVANVDTTNASNITSGTLSNDRLGTIPYAKLSGVASSAQGTNADNAVATIATYGNIVTHNTSEFATSAQGTKADSALQPSDVINDVTHTDTQKPLSALQGKELSDRIQNIANIGRYLSNWNATTGLPTTQPQTIPYSYVTGMYYVVSVIGTTNYRPSGNTYTGQPSTTVETETLEVGDFYLYDGTSWSLLKNTGVKTVFENIGGSPYDNSNLAAALNAKQNTIDSTHKLSADLVDDSTTTNKFVTAQDKANWNNKVDKNNAITAGTKCKITYDAKGLVTGGSNLETSDIPDLSATYYLASNPNGYITSSAITGKEDTSNKVTSISSSSTNTQYPSAKAVNDFVGNGTITITQGGSTKGTFTTNQSGNTTIALDAGGGGGAAETNKVKDVVESYSNLLSYPQTGLAVKDLILVKSDYTHSDQESYYRWAIGEANSVAELPAVLSHIGEIYRVNTTPATYYKATHDLIAQPSIVDDNYGETWTRSPEHDTVVDETQYYAWECEYEEEEETWTEYRYTDTLNIVVNETYVYEYWGIPEETAGMVVQYNPPVYSDPAWVQKTSNADIFTYQTNISTANYVTLNTAQDILNTKTFHFDESEIAVGNQTYMLQCISTQYAAEQGENWGGRFICGCTDKTFLLGCYNNLAGIGAHKWADAYQQTGAAWSDFHLNPDGEKYVYIGGYHWYGNSGWLKVENNNSASARFRTFINSGTASSPTWRTVLPNMTTGSNAVFLTPYVSNSTNQNYSVSIGYGAIPTGTNATNIGYNAKAGANGTAVGSSAVSTASYAIQIGQGTNSTANTLSVGLKSNLNVQLLDSNGKIPDARLNLTSISGYNRGVAQSLEHDASGNLIWVNK